MFSKKRILVTGGTGSFGNKFIEFAFANANPLEIVVFSRDEFKQFEMAKRFPPSRFPIRYFLGDIRDKDRLHQAFIGVDYIVHAAALKQVPALEYNPFEAVKTNILGAQNIVEVALEHSVQKVVAVSTDKAASPINLYGATKLVMEKIIVAANSYVRYRDVSFCAVRYGNVVGSRGSVLPFFLDLIQKGVRELPVTDLRMTRFWIQLDRGVQLVCKALQDGTGGEILIPKIPSITIRDLIEAMPVACTYKEVGIRPGEKLHESLIGEDEGRNAVDAGDHYVILPQFEFQRKINPKLANLPKTRDGFRYVSNENDVWLTVPQLREMIGNLDLMPT
jgi:UDP-N-acetylglucosamine 4,6-dehydratase/5-epimerase